MPGAFTPGCSVRHLPGYIENFSVLKDKGVDLVVVIAFNDAWVMDAWRKANGVSGDGIVSSPFFVALYSMIDVLYLAPNTLVSRGEEGT